MSLSPERTTPGSGSPMSRPHQKRCRLSVACNQCRKRKVRCDTTLPKCRNCVVRNEHCETSDPRDPEGGLTVRSVAAKSVHDRDAWRAPSLSGEGRRRQSGSGSRSEERTALRTFQTRLTAETQPRDAEGDIPWVSRAYQASIEENQCESLGGSTPDVVINTDDTAAYRVKFVGGSSVQSLCSFIDLHLTTKGLQPICPQFRHGMHHSEEFVLPLITSLPLLPPRDKIEGYTKVFFERVWPIVPVVDQAALQAEIDHVLDLQSRFAEAFYAHLTPINVTNLSIIYAVICIGVDETAGRLTKMSTTYLTAAYGLYGHLVALPYATSVQALTLLAVALRGQSKDGQAWQVLGQAIRIAHSIGLHKPAHTQGGPRAPVPSLVSSPLNNRLWWSCYALERVMQLECGRPSQLGDKDMETPPSGLASTGTPDYFAAWVGLTRIMGQISDRFYSRRPTSSLDLFETVQYLDRMLLDWEKSLPDGVRQSQDGVYGGEQETGDLQPHLVSFLSMQFHLAHMTLLRLSLIFPPKGHAEQLKLHRASLPSYTRLSNTTQICSAAARSTIHDALNLADRGETSVLFSTTPIFISCIVLALGILRQPARRVARADLELLSLGTELVEGSFSRWVHGDGLSSMPALLTERVTEFFNAYDTRRPVASGSAATYRSTDGGSQSGIDARTGEAGGLDTIPFSFDVSGLEMEPFEALQFDELWDMMGSDLLLDHSTIHVA